MDERRRELRARVSLPVRVWLGDGVVAKALAVDASPGGMRLSVSPRVQALICAHQSYFVEVELAYAPVACVAEVRHFDGGVGIMLKERVPELANAGVLGAAETQAA